MRSNALPVFIALFLLAGAVYWFATSDAAAEVTQPGNFQPRAGATGENSSTNQSGDDVPKQPVRRQAPEITRRAVPAGSVGAKADSAQGVMGRLISPTGVPVAGAEVYLIRGAGIDSIQLMLRYQKGDRFPPMAKAISAADGTFRVGLQKYETIDGFEKTYEVRILHPDFCDHRIERVKPQPNDWVDYEDVVLKRGVTIFGSVYSASGTPLMGATVTAKPQFSHGMLSVPGREAGIETKTDRSGNYEIRNVDRLDLLSLSAHALNHTHQEKTELNLEGDRVQIDFHLESGFEIAGSVMDENGNPIGGAKVTANGMSQKSPQSEETYTRNDGSFLVIGLRDSQFTLVVEAHGFGTATEKPIKAGDLEVSIVLERLGSVEITVLGRNGTPLTSYTCNIKVVISGDDNFGKPMHRQQVRNAPEGTATVLGLTPNKYVAEIIHKDYAKNFSTPFEIAAGQTHAAVVTVQLNQGGTLRGIVRDLSGKPIGNVQVSTQPKGTIDNALIRAFGGVPYTITRGMVKSKSNGSFAFKRLLPGEYQLEFKHNDFCTLLTNGNVAVLDRITDLPPTSLERGALVSGIARVSGKATAQVKVTVSAKTVKGKPATFNTEATTDNNGLFLLPKRLAPGDYEARGAQMGLGPFMVMMQFQKITKFTIPKGTEHHQLIIDVPPVAK